MFFLNNPRVKIANCWHIYEKKYPYGPNEPRERCIKCGYTRKVKPENKNLDPYLISVSKQSNISTELPLRKTRDYVEHQQLFTNWLTVADNDWRFPATEEPYDSCGLWKTTGCLNSKKHASLGYGDTTFVKHFQYSCYRPVCKICYVKWITREAKKATKRIEKAAKMLGMTPIHMFFSVSPDNYSWSFEDLRKKANLIVKELHIIGAAMIFHPYRYDEGIGYHYSPQFHIVGFGYIKGRIVPTYEKYRWYIGYAGPRISVFETFVYLLSHAGTRPRTETRKRTQTVTWLGKISYSKLKMEKEPKKGICPYCKEKLVEIYYQYDFHPNIPPDKYFEGLVDSDGWYPVRPIPEYEVKQNRFDYDSRRDVNETLKGLAEAN